MVVKQCHNSDTQYIFGGFYRHEIGKIGVTKSEVNVKRPQGGTNMIIGM